MTHYLIELAIWILIAFFLGCFIGYLLRGMLGSREPASPTPPAPEATNKQPLHSRHWMVKFGAIRDWLSNGTAMLHYRIPSLTPTSLFRGLLRSMPLPPMVFAVARQHQLYSSWPTRRASLYLLVTRSAGVAAPRCL